MFESLYVQCETSGTTYKYKVDLQGDMTNINMDLRKFEHDYDDDSYVHHDLLASIGNIHLHKYSLERYLMNFMSLYLDTPSKYIEILVGPWLDEYDNPDNK